ncbi:hypothetical protein J3458_021259 [Metarhizium acridum]|uniref:uncharacterized protein n=1 Tax=Metarhizium acridum TaxID=92637 RepID=UPI001C6B63D7|nr:hypothetical protein J3458_021259 [Metarhizium acridum]
MSYAVRRIIDSSTAPNSSGDPPPTTATVLDYSCLFTHDLRRKQKRWQDGRLKYHTFNKRIMVYDDRGNFIGDAHWHGVGDLEEDEELELDRGAAIVQVGECRGSREQDLAAILDKRAREVEKRRAMAAAKAPTTSRARTQPQQQQREHQPHLQLNHRPLSSIVPSPGPIGRAVISDRSPYEARKAEGAATDGPPAKKRRVSPSPPSKAGYAQSLFGTRLNLGGSGGMASLRMRALRERTNLQREVDGGERRPSEGDEDVIIVDEKRSKVVVKKPRHLQESTLRDTVPMTDKTRPKGLPTTAEVDEKRRPDAAQSSRQPNVESSAATGQTVERRSRLKMNQNTRQFDEGLETTAPISAEDVVLVEERPARLKWNADLPPVVNDPEPRAMTELHLEGADLARSVRHGDTMQMERQAVPAATKPQVAVNTTTRGGTPQYSPEAIGIESSLGVAEPQKTARKEPKQRQKVATSTAISKLHRPVSSPRRPEKRAELRIKPTRRRGLLMLSERRQEQQRHPASVTPTSSVHSVEITNADNAGPSKSPKLQVSESDTEPSQAFKDLDEGEAIKATPESPPRHYTEMSINLDFNSESDLPAVKSRSKESSREHAETVSDPDQRAQRSRKKQQRSPKRPTNGQSSESESDDLPPRRTRRLGRKATSRDSLGSSADEDGVNHTSPKKTRKTETRSASESPLTGCSSEEDSEQRPARQPKRTRSKRDSVSGVGEKSEEPKGPRITRMARKSVKCKEIFGFVLPPGQEELAPAPFAMAAARIGTVGRPPAAPTRLPGITLTIKPEPVVSAPPTPGLTERQHIESAKDSSGDAAAKEQNTGLPVQEAIHDDPKHSERGLKPVGATEMTVEDSVSKEPIAKEAAISEQGTLPKPTIINPATRGRKAARKKDAAGPAPQTIVPFEAPQHVRLCRSKQPEPRKSDKALPGFTSANGGAWSKHAEDLLGMTRPTGKKGMSMTTFG